MALKVNEKSQAVKDMESSWDKIDSLCGGTDAMRLAGQKYLPQFPAEADDSYSYRLATSTLFNGLGRTVKNMASKPFAKPATFTDVEPAQAGVVPERRPVRKQPDRLRIQRDDGRSEIWPDAHAGRVSINRR